MGKDGAYGKRSEKGDRIFYTCGVCGLAYEEKILAER